MPARQAVRAENRDGALGRKGFLSPPSGHKTGRAEVARHVDETARQRGDLSAANSETHGRQWHG
jgi:hypothetical protein